MRTFICVLRVEIRHWIWSSRGSTNPAQESTEEGWEIEAAPEGWLGEMMVDQPGWGWRQKGLRFRRYKGGCGSGEA